MPYGIMRIEKRNRTDVAGIQKEANRTKEEHDKGLEFDRSDIDWSLTDSNITLIHTENWNRAITEKTKEIEAQTGRKTRKDAVVMLDGLFTASPEFFEGKSTEEIQKYFEDCLAFYIKEFCQGDASRVINAVIHLDEATPHMQLASIPILTSEAGDRLNAKTIMGGVKEYRLHQDRFYSEVSSRHGLERGEPKKPAETRAHTTKREWQIAQQEEAISKNNGVIQKQFEQYTAAKEAIEEQGKILQDTKDKIETLSNEALQNIKVNRASDLFNRDTITVDRESYTSLTEAVKVIGKEAETIAAAENISQKKAELNAVTAQITAAKRELAAAEFDRDSVQNEYTEMKRYIDTYKGTPELGLSIKMGLLQDENAELTKESARLKSMLGQARNVLIALMRELPLPGRWRDRLNQVLNSLSDIKSERPYNEREV